MNRQKWTVAASGRKALKSQIESVVGLAQLKPEQYCDWRLDLSEGLDKLVAKQFSNGTFYLEGKPSLLWDKVVLTVEKVLGGASAPSSNSQSGQAVGSQNTALSFPYIGQDESGKGDYFGGLVVAGVCLDATLAKQLKDLGVQDSKALSAGQIETLAKSIQNTLPQSAYTVIALTPEAYNQAYAEMVAEGFSLNQLLGSLHAQVFETLFKANAGTQSVMPKSVMIDQFGKPQDVLRFVSPAITKKVQFAFETKAEKYVGVAAASILARAAFVEQMKDLALLWQTEIPLGATHVMPQAKTFVQKHGAQALGKVAKMHFKTTQSVLQS